jgi:hypothetical protein
MATEISEGGVKDETPVISNSNSSISAYDRVLSGLYWLGTKIFFGMESIGNVVVSVLGLDQSRYQYVIDGMTQEDWKLAKQVQQKRDLEVQYGKDSNLLKELENGGAIVTDPTTLKSIDDNNRA